MHVKFASTRRAFPKPPAGHKPAALSCLRVGIPVSRILEQIDMGDEMGGSMSSTQCLTGRQCLWSRTRQMACSGVPISSARSLPLLRVYRFWLLGNASLFCIARSTMDSRGSGEIDCGGVRGGGVHSSGAVQGIGRRDQTWMGKLDRRGACTSTWLWLFFSSSSFLAVDGCQSAFRAMFACSSGAT